MGGRFPHRPCSRFLLCCPSSSQLGSEFRGGLRVDSGLQRKGCESSRPRAEAPRPQRMHSKVLQCRWDSRDLGTGPEDHQGPLWRPAHRHSQRVGRPARQQCQGGSRGSIWPHSSCSPASRPLCHLLIFQACLSSLLWLLLVCISLETCSAEESMASFCRLHSRVLNGHTVLISWKPLGSQ